MKFLVLTVFLSIIILNQATAQQPVKKVAEVEKTTKNAKVKKTPLQQSSKLKLTKTVAPKSVTNPIPAKLVKEANPNLQRGTNVNSKKAVLSSPKTTTLKGSSKQKINSATSANSNQANVIQYEKTGDPIQDAANYREAKEAYLAKHPELKQTQTKVRKMSKSEYNQLPASRKAVVDANPSRFQIVD